MGFLDVLERIGSGIGGGLETLGNIQQNQRDLRRFGPNYREILEQQDTERRLDLQRARAQTRTAEASADVNEIQSTNARRAQEAADSYHETVGRAAHLSDVDGVETGKETFVQTSLNSQFAADRESDRLDRTAKDVGSRVAIARGEDTLENFAEDTAQSRFDADVSTERGVLALKQDKRDELLNERFQIADAELKFAEDVKRADRLDAKEEEARLKGVSPKGRKDIKSGAGAGFSNRVDVIIKGNQEATAEFEAEIAERAASELQVAMAITARGGVGILNPAGQPLTPQDIRAIQQEQVKTKLPLKEVFEGLGFKLDTTGQNSSPQLLAQIAGQPEAFRQQQAMQNATEIVQNFNSTFPNVLSAAADGELLNDDQVQAMNLILETMEEVIGTDFTRYPPEVRDALKGILDRRASTPNGQVR